LYALGVTSSLAITSQRTLLARGTPSLARGVWNRQFVFIASVASVAVMLVAEGFGQQVSKGYGDFAMGIALAVEVVNYRADRHAKLPDERSRAPHPTS
jgi:hypothetical protein